MKHTTKRLYIRTSFSLFLFVITIYLYAVLKEYILTRVSERYELVYKLFKLRHSRVDLSNQCTKTKVLCLTDKECEEKCIKDPTSFNDYITYKCDNFICNINLNRSSLNDKVCEKEHLGVVPIINDIDSLELTNPNPLWRCISYFNHILNDDGEINPGVCERGELINTASGLWCKCNIKDILLTEKNTNIPRCVRHSHLYVKNDVNFF